MRGERRIEEWRKKEEDRREVRREEGKGGQKGEGKGMEGLVGEEKKIA